MTDQQQLAVVLDGIAATATRIDGHLKRIAAALERLAPPAPMAEAPPCIRCGGQGWLGNEAATCPTCDGTGQRPT